MEKHWLNKPQINQLINATTGTLMAHLPNGFFRSPFFNFPPKQPVPKCFYSCFTVVFGTETDKSSYYTPECRDLHEIDWLSKTALRTDIKQFLKEWLNRGHKHAANACHFALENYVSVVNGIHQSEPWILSALWVICRCPLHMQVEEGLFWSAVPLVL